ncbi:MAG: thioredoxin-like domain-containing protein [Prevotella sp.]
MKQFLATAAIMAASFALTACDDGPRFHVEGNIGNATDSVLYFENISLERPVVIDSVRLDESGAFSFSDKAPAAPEFYRLRIAGQTINISADSTETIVVRAKFPDIATGYEVSGSANCERIRELSLMQIELHNRALALEANTSMSRSEIRDSLLAIIDAYKHEVTTYYIFKDPKAASSYFALFQTLGNYLIFNPHNNRDDIRVFAAVATSWDTFYPEAVRSINLHNIALKGMNDERIAAQNRKQVIDESKVTRSGIIDLNLPDSDGRERKLSALAGNVVLLDFHVFASKDSPKRILTLRDLYNKYHERGFEIYQVSLDTDKHFWKQQTASLPWVSVLAPDGLSSTCLTTYNVPAVPEFFLIDRENNLVSRSSQIQDVGEEIEKLL